MRRGPAARIAFRAALVAAMAWVAPSAVAETPEEGRDWHRPEDYARALEFFHALACRGNAAAQESLGSMYASGQGAPRDFVRAHRWMSLALAQADGAARDRRRAMLAELEAKMTPDEIARARAATNPCASGKDQV
jgi:TPR repeat protein